TYTTDIYTLSLHDALPISTRFATEGGDRFELAGRELHVADAYGSVSSYERIDPWTPTRDRLQELAGTYASDEAETVLAVAASSRSEEHTSELQSRRDLVCR